MSRRRVRKESDELLCTVLVTRYGPQSVASASDWLRSNVYTRRSETLFGVYTLVV